ncbi:MAG TPA: DUF1549 domain-containing protein, partial [Planctomycetota bacterium]|nr:DUF1549 domain-containing protein [Planctomycetota bacterium]
MRALLVALLLAPQETPPPDGERIFLEQVLPVFQAKCLGCHGEDPKGKIRGGLDLRTRATALKGGDTGPSLVPGKPDDSLLMKAVLRGDEDTAMPPKEADRLTPGELEAVRAWIAAGAPWAEPKGPWGAGSAADRWAFYPLKNPSPPAVAGHPIDAFVNAKLAEKGLKPAGPADPATLLRRVTIDLTGLPPTPQDVASFLADREPGAWERRIDALLASPAYGEQWARHWLDVVRYADTSGFSNDFERPNAWRYRDYVIRSLNRDVPFRQFILDQVAGDQIDPEDPEKLIATGFLRMGPWEHTAMSVAAVTRQFFLDDVTHSTAATFLGLTMRCARCHD